MSALRRVRLDSIHELLDDIALLIGAPALVEDTEHVLVAYSRHDDPGDVVRAATILGRQASPAVSRWLAELGIAHATGACRIPANPELGMSARVCVPLRSRGQLFGYLWFIDEDMDMSAFELERAEQSAHAIVNLLWHDPTLVELSSVATVRATLQGEPSDDPQVERLLDARLQTGGSLRVVALQHRERPTPTLDLRRCLSTVAHRLAEVSPVAAVVDDLGVVVCAEPGEGARLPALAARSLAHVGGDDVVMGIGDPVAEVASMPLAWQTARHALTCGLLWPAQGPVVDWHTAGMYRLVPGMAQHTGPERDLVQRLRDIWASSDQEHLARTAETYLDLAGHAQETAGVLVLHRATLYQRLQRFSDVVGVDLRDGATRTLVHLALKAARFKLRSS